MAHFVVEFSTPLSAPDAWSRLWDLRAHDAVIPLTRVSSDSEIGPLSLGQRFTARTELLGVGVDDSMEVVEFDPPDLTTAGRCRIVKTGSVITGTVVVTVSPAAPSEPGASSVPAASSAATASGARIRWEQNIGVAHVPGFLAPVTALLAHTAYRRTLRLLLEHPQAG